MAFTYNGARYTGTAKPHSSSGYTGGTANERIASERKRKKGSGSTKTIDILSSKLKEKFNVVENKETGQITIYGNQDIRKSVRENYNINRGAPYTKQEGGVGYAPPANLPYSTHMKQDASGKLVPAYGIQTKEGFVRTPSPTGTVIKQEKPPSRWQRINTYVGEKTGWSSKVVPSQKNLLAVQEKYFYELKKQKVRGTGFFAETNTGKPKVSDIWYSLNPKYNRAKYSDEMILAVKEGKTWEEYKSDNLQLGMVTGGTELIRTQPVTVAAFQAAGLGIGLGGVMLASTGAAGATAVSVGGKALMAGWGLSVVGEYKSKENKFEKGEVLGRTAVEYAGLHVGSGVGGELGLKAGFMPQQPAKIKYREVRLETPKGETKTLWRGLVAESGTGKGKVLVGKGDKFGFGERSLDVDFSRLPKGKIIDVSSPASRQVLERALPKYGRAGEETKFKTIIGLSEQTYKTKGTVYDTKFEQPKTYKTREGFDFTISELSKKRTWIGKKKGFLYGSTTVAPLLKPELKAEFGSGSDVDVLLKGYSQEGAKFASTHAKELRGYGEKSYVSKDNPLLVKTAGDKHMIDIHTIDYGGREVVAESLYGVPFTGKEVRIGKSASMTLGETGARKASSILTPRVDKGELYFEPEPHRMKDIKHYFSIGEELKAGSGESLRNLYPENMKFGGDVKSPRPYYGMKVSKSLFGFGSVSNLISSKSSSNFGSLSALSGSLSESGGSSISPSPSPSDSGSGSGSGGSSGSSISSSSSPSYYSFSSSFSSISNSYYGKTKLGALPFGGGGSFFGKSPVRRVRGKPKYTRTIEGVVFKVPKLKGKYFSGLEARG